MAPRDAGAIGGACRAPAAGRKSARTGAALRTSAIRVACLLLAASLAASARAQEPEPPPEAAEGDWSAERADSLAPGWLETTFTSRGRLGTAPQSGERMSFRSGDASGTLRAGAEPLAGTRLKAPLARGTLGAGRLAPRWGRGLLLGAAAQPWAAQADDRGDDAPLRGHSGDGATWRSGGGGLECLAGRFARCTLAGECRHRPRPGACPHAGGASAAFSLSAEGESFAAEVALDARGRWRAETLARRRQGRALTVLRARGGLDAFRSLAEPLRAGPARVLSAATGVQDRSRSLRASGALWTFAAGAAGAVATLEVEQRLVQHANVAVGFEEQQGTRRDPAQVAVPASSNGFRQGWWCEWRCRGGGRSLDLRHELRGGRAFARQAVRRAVLVRGESGLPRGGSLAIQHSVWSARTGESSWIPESDGDVWTLRSAPGAGERTQVTIAAPLLGGRGKAAVEWTTTPARDPVPGWSLEWTRRTRQ